MKGRDYMLTKEAKQILDYALSAFKSGNSEVYIRQIIDNVGLPDFEIEPTINYLVDEGYFKIKRFKSGSFIYAPSHKAFHYQNFESASPLTTSQTNIFNAPVSNSAIANTGKITINNGASFSELRSFINSKNISDADKAAAIRIVYYVETLAENEAPLKKGFLSKFGDTLSKLDWLPELLGKVLIKYLSGL